MTVHVMKKADRQQLERMFLEAAYSGERFILQRDDGSSVGIVPVEDMAILEGMEEQYINSAKFG